MNLEAAVKDLDLYHVAIVGGLGHVGLPLGIVFASKGLKVCLYDLNKSAAEKVGRGEMPFVEYGAEPLLNEVLQKGLLKISDDVSSISRARYVIIAVGTPVDEYLNPKTRVMLDLFEKLHPYFSPEQTIIIRSTVCPNTCKQIYSLLNNLSEKQGKKATWKLAYCPERIIQGYSVKELGILPQIVSAFTEETQGSASRLFEIVSPKIIKTAVTEAELVKLFCNAYRYIVFATTNQFHMISHKLGVDYNKVRAAMVEGYGRAGDLPTAGLTEGPCLLKDTMQLAAFDSNQFLLGHSAMMINEGLPNFVIDDLRKRHDLSKKTIGILGMAFKAEIDDIRDSLAFKIAKILKFHGAKVLCSDEYAKIPNLVSKEEILKSCDIIIIGVPHSAYKGLVVPPNAEVVDLWGITTLPNHT